jgi:hypothetical protein
LAQAVSDETTTDAVTTTVVPDMSFSTFSYYRRLARGNAHRALVNRCRGHERAHFRFWDYQVPADRRSENLSYWRGRKAYFRSLSNRCRPYPDWIYNAFMCIHRYEGAWNANTGNGYYGGLQMDRSFMSSYGGEFLSRYGTADKWAPSTQILVGYRAWKLRGFYPWPNTARACGLI